MGVVAIMGLVLLIATTVRALLRGDAEGVERQDAGASVDRQRAGSRGRQVRVLAVGGVRRLPRVTSTVPAAIAGLGWMLGVRMGSVGWGERMITNRLPVLRA